MDRTAVVSGASRGIGAGIAARLVRDGFGVVSIDILEPDPDERQEGVEYRVVDISDPPMVTEFFADLARVDVLVNNAGIQRVGLVGRQDLQEWLQVIGINLNGAYFCTREAILRMPEGGAVVSIASTAALLGMPGRASYSAAKAGLLALTRVLAVEVATQGIRVNAVCPGFTRTAIVEQGLGDGSLNADWMLERVPMARLAEISEIANAVSFLASDQASYVTGQALVVDGGWTIQGINHSPDWLKS